ncbi:MAG: hypothetical protein CVU91_07410 [Firmicutes bacterium HGW-Firmicutes-16]|nr:MAG: hypothetical protein CVU91_07410 [Firmicutes bacterium HGW-Firmicutes-16]
MTPDILEATLAAEITTIFTGYTLKNSDEAAVALNVFVHDIPVIQGDDEGDSEAPPPEPYIVVKATSGNIASEDDPQAVTVVLVICVFDDANERQGHKDILHIIQKVYERFAKNPVLAGKFVLKYPIDWVLQDEDTYPYYFGGMQLLFECHAIKKEDPLA